MVFSCLWLSTVAFFQYLYTSCHSVSLQIWVIAELQNSDIDFTIYESKRVMIHRGRKLLDTWSLTVHILILVELCQGHRDSFALHNFLWRYIHVSKCCRFSQEQQSCVTTLIMISTRVIVSFTVWFKELRKLHLFMLSCSLLYFHIPLDLSIMSLLLFYWNSCAEISSQYYRSRNNGYFFPHVIMITFFWISVCAFLSFSSL